MKRFEETKVRKWIILRQSSPFHFCPEGMARVVDASNIEGLPLRIPVTGSKRKTRLANRSRALSNERNEPVITR